MPKNEIAKIAESGDVLGKMLEMFEKFTSKIIDEMSKNAKIHSEMMTCEMFELKKRADDLEKDNLKLRQENELIKKKQESLEARMEKYESSLDDSEQIKLKDEVVVTGNLQVESLSSVNLANYFKKSCDVTITPASITKISPSKNKMGQTVVRMTIANSAERVTLLKSKKPWLKKKYLLVRLLQAKNSSY